jgi:hypothetical protein
MKTIPLEETFEVEPYVKSDVIEYEEKDNIVGESYDEKDKSLDEEFDNVYVKALDAYSSLSEELEFVEGKYKARVGEVSNQFLNTALNAAKEKANLKGHKDNLVMKETNKTTNNNLFVGNHEELLKLLKDTKK